MHSIDHLAELLLNAAARTCRQSPDDERPDDTRRGTMRAFYTAVLGDVGDAPVALAALQRALDDVATEVEAAADTDRVTRMWLFEA